MRFTSRKKRHPPVLIIVPLIDILLVLLIFIMVTSTFKRQPAVRLTLPESNRSLSVRADDSHLLVTVAKEAPYFFLGPRAVTLEKLREDLLEAANRNPQTHLSIAADQGAPFGKVIKVLDIADEARFKTIDAFTREAPSP